MSSQIEKILIATCIRKKLGWIPDPTGHWFSNEAWAEFSQRAKGTLTTYHFWKDLEQHPRMSTFYRYPQHGEEQEAT